MRVSYVPYHEDTMRPRGIMPQRGKIWDGLEIRPTNPYRTVHTARCEGRSLER
jgi:hypothetical protein